MQRNHPHITSLDPFVILHAPASTGDLPRQSGLLDELLRHFLAKERVQPSAADKLSISPPHVFQIQEQGPDNIRQPEIIPDLTKLSDDFDTVLGALIPTFQQAQIGFWNGLDEDSQASRMLWLEHTIKAALLENLPRQGLADDEKAAMYALLDGAFDSLAVEAIQVTLGTDGEAHTVTLPDLLLITTSGTRNLVLQCKPCGSVHRHVDLPSFATALQRQLAQSYRFEALSWAHTPVIGRPFAFQARQLLNGILDDIGRLRIGGLATVDELERQLRQVSDPSAHFFDLPSQERTAPAVRPPRWLLNASTEDRYAYHTALLDLAANQGRSKGCTSLSDVEDIRDYAARRLRETLQARYPDKAVHDPNEVHIRISQAIIGAGTQGQSLFLRTVPLTDLAISRLRLEAGEVMTGLSFEDGSPVKDWLSIEQIRALIHQVDIGAHYPTYLQDQVRTEPRRSERIRQHAREWRYALRFSTLKAKIERQLGETASQAMLRFCQGMDNGADLLRIAPLAFLCAPGASASDVAHGMFIIEIPASGSWVLYRPFYADRALQEFPTLELLMDAVRSRGALQESVLAWLDDDARPIYQNDGFKHPHLHPDITALTHLLNVPVELLDGLLQRLTRPVQVLFKAWTEDLATHLFNARIDTMLLASASNSVSNAQEVRALVKEAAWAIFNTVTQLWHGPMTTLAWLVVALSAAKEDVEALIKRSGDNKIVAAIDLLTNMALLLAHRPATPPANSEAAVTLRFSGPAPKEESPPPALEQPQEKPWQAPVEAPQPTRVRVESWHDEQRLSNLSVQERQSLAQLQASQSLEGHAPLTRGRLRGLFNIAGRYYVKLGDDVYEVIETWNGMQIIGPEPSSSEWVSQWDGAPDGYHIVGRERPKGPWLTRWHGQWTLNLTLLGGMPRNRLSINAENRQRFDTLSATATANQQALNQMAPLMERSQVQLQGYDDLAREYSMAVDALPAHERDTPPPALQLQRQALKAQRLRHLPEIRASALYLERQSTLLHGNIEVFKEMAEPRFSKFDTRAPSRRRYGNWYGAAIENDMLLCRRLLEQVDHQALSAQSIGLPRVPETAEQIQQYLDYCERVRDSSQASRRLLVVSQRLDRTLAQVLPDPKIEFADKATKLAQTIRRRTYSTLVIRAQLLSDLAYLAVDKTRLSADTAEHLLAMRAPLSGIEFSRTIWSHDGLEATEETAQVKAELLEDILQKYRTVLDRAQYMKTLDSPALVADVLDEYIRELSTITQITEQQLSATLTNLDSGITLPPPTPYHRPATIRRRVIRVDRGRPLLVEIDQMGNRAIQRSAFNQEPAGSFAQRDGVWHAVPEQARPARHDRAQLRQRASRLLAEVDGKIAFAAHYADEPNSLADFLEWPAGDMREVQQQLTELNNPLDSSLVDLLRAAVDRVNHERLRLLTDAYLNTRHPDGKALRFLAEQKRVRIRQTVIRRQLRHANDYLDVYEIRDVQAPQRLLWEAHFHYPSLEARGHDFVKGHLKFWDTGVRGRKALLEQAASARERIAIYRGDLRLEQVIGIIPFPADAPQ
ncbi:hypothetical protein FCH83_14185 [Pseudomonas putida]|nr:DUF6543 domain-containing protein [Pseudomonas putida]NTY94488.1 hypothetical protein [Pseudomonas putida]NTZ01917.1 hypothetical protein [Pseudomonas putida]NTZ23927.1 hypothetical protein [Pseudomonas putida]NTZ56752.1 hypothetical protein [Pseudomonas putida]NTZ67250.1 hypothetical protein [Pseudomonas putida]